MITVDLFETLQTVWETIRADYDVTTDLPDVGTLFDGVDPSMPAEAAQMVLVNLLSDAMECTSRFSPWYKKPASAYGVVLRRDAAHANRWGLTDAARRARRPLLDSLSQAIWQNRSVILATRYLSELRPDPDEPCLAAVCQCNPPRTILMQHAVFARATIICDACRQPFR